MKYFFAIMIFKEFSLDFAHLSNTCLQWIERIQIVQGEMLTMDIFTLMGKESVYLEPDFEMEFFTVHVLLAISWTWCCTA